MAAPTARFMQEGKVIIFMTMMVVAAVVVLSTAPLLTSLCLDRFL